MKKKVYAIMAAGILGSASVYGIVKLEANSCSDLEKKIAQLSEQSRSTWFTTEYSRECKNLEKYVKCWWNADGSKCMDGKVYGKSLGGTKACKPEKNAKICSWWD
jgi:hypothetical protein